MFRFITDFAFSPSVFMQMLETDPALGPHNKVLIQLSEDRFQRRSASKTYFHLRPPNLLPSESSIDSMHIRWFLSAYASHINTIWICLQGKWITMNPILHSFELTGKLHWKNAVKHKFTVIQTKAQQFTVTVFIFQRNLKWPYKNNGDRNLFAAFFLIKDSLGNIEW